MSSIPSSIAAAMHATSSGATRGRERAIGNVAAIQPAAGGLGFAAPHASGTWLAVLGSAHADGPNRWSYDWEECSPHATTPGRFVSVSGSARSSATWGRAWNGFEVNNSASGVQGCGINADTLPAGFVFKPIGAGAVVEMSGPFVPGGGGDEWCFFLAPNAVDGECADSGAALREADGALLDSILLGEDGEDENNPLVGSDGLWLLGAEAQGLPSADLDDLAQVLCDGDTGWWLLDADNELMTSRELAAPARNLLNRLLLDASGIPIASNDGSILLTE